ncbi:hypothetical protein M231_00673 [Tremella mesenterica]|uniref:ATP-dependent DNA helicase PIF1 n=1 Tax=Tremella mesenterica TaxID=5217 RepID=A0A4Q1BV97_TREME|nr:hypothetical protein M231_00673 [Tremella mesenterica]
MPSLFSTSSASAGTENQTRSFSRVNSLKRDWSEPEPAASSLKAAPVEFQWTDSPQDKPKMPSTVTVESAADRRRKAILAAMSPNTSSPSGSTSSKSSLKEPPVQQLPSLPSASSAGPSVLNGSSMSSLGSDLKKRAMPWEEDQSTTKKAMLQRPNSRNSARSNSNKSTKSGGVMDIRQKIVLSTEQQKVLSLVVAEGKNIFFTGSAGTGKSVLLREIIKSLRKKYVTTPDAVAIAASTGIAACNIGGVTLHSFGGVGLAVDKPDVLLQKLRMNKKAAARWQRTKVLIVDEISMVDGDLFDRFCKLGQMIRKNQKPWGGIQVIVTGDFFQLPPVTKNNQQPKFCFEAVTWDETISMSVNLTKVFRQKDQRFVDMLNEMRFGRLTPESIKAFQSLSRQVKYDDGIEPTELFPRREDVDRSNAHRLEALLTDGYTYAASDTGTITDPIQRQKVLSNFLAVEQLSLRVDAQVMLIKNMDETLVNGSMGKVIGFCHKQLYFTDTAGRWLPDGPDGDDMDETIREKLEKTRKLVESKIAGAPNPVVQFKVPGGGMRDVLVEMDQFKVELPNGEVQASRTQLPLILAWAMSIHKSQGQTLDRVKVNLGKVFEKGQAYVALSRATSLEGLEVIGFNASKVMAHQKVAVWSRKLRDLND